MENINYTELNIDDLKSLSGGCYGDCVNTSDPRGEAGAEAVGYIAGRIALFALALYCGKFV